MGETIRLAYSTQYMDKQFSFLCGLPRSGTTVLTSLLSQNPAVFASPNSALIEVLVNVRKHLDITEQARAFTAPTQVTDTLLAIMEGMYRFTERPYILDKSRAWPHPDNLELLLHMLPQPPRLVAMVRDLPDVLASFIVKIEAQGGHDSFVDRHLTRTNQAYTTKNRCEVLFAPGGTVYEAWTSLEQAFTKGYRDLFVCIEYDDFVTTPASTLETLYTFLGWPAYQHDFRNIHNPTPEDDRVYGIDGLHEVRPVLQKTAPDPAVVLGAELYEKYAAVPHFWREGGSLKNKRRNRNPFFINL